MAISPESAPASLPRRMPPSGNRAESPRPLRVRLLTSGVDENAETAFSWQPVLRGAGRRSWRSPQGNVGESSAVGAKPNCGANAARSLTAWSGTIAGNHSRPKGPPVVAPTEPRVSKRSLRWHRTTRSRR